MWKGVAVAQAVWGWGTHLNITHDGTVLIVQEFHAHLGHGTPRASAAKHEFNPGQLRTGIAELILHPHNISSQHLSAELCEQS
jgi:hypothetical protein